MEDIDQLKDLPRSERVLRIFDHPDWDEEPWLPEYQQELLDYGQSKPKAEAAVKPGRQVGKTLTGALIAADYAVTHRNVDVLITAPFQETADEMFRETKQYFKSSPFSLDEFGVIDDNKKTWEFNTGTRLLSRTLGKLAESTNTKSGPGQRGKSPQCVVVDEAHYAQDGHYTNVIEPFFITHEEYEYYLFSTPRGKNGYFYEKVEKDDNWFSPHWPTTISPFAQQDFIERKREELDSITFAKEYEGKFVDEGDSFFPYDKVDKVLQPSTSLEGKTWLGVDVARKGKDRTVYTAIDENGTVDILASEETSTIPGIVGQIKVFHREYNFESVLVDENAVGGGVVDDEELNEWGIMNGVSFTTKSKHDMYNKLKSDLESENLTLPNERRLVDELTSLQFSVTQNGYYKISHPDGGHDDYPDSLALANYGRHGGGKATVTRRKARSNSFTSA